MTQRNRVEDHYDVFEHVIEDYKIERTSLHNIDIEMVSDHYEWEDDCEDLFVWKSLVYISNIEMAMCHCEHENDNEDHRVWKNFWNIGNICEVYPTGQKNEMS